MNRYRCPAALANERAHTAFLTAVSRFQKRLAKEGMTEPVLRELHWTAESWVRSHICTTDVHLLACVQSQDKRQAARVGVPDA